MAVVVIGGHSRDVGKTSVVAGLISALPEFHWLAMKITQYGHGICSANGDPCDCATADHSLAVSEERNRTGDTDTSRFLVAGADRVLWVRTQQGMLAEAMPRVRAEMAKAENVILESNSVMRFLRPTIYVAVLDPSRGDFKDSAREFLDRADAILLRAGNGEVEWNNVSLKPVQSKPFFEFTPPQYVPAEFANFVRERIARRDAELAAH
jgi:molybdopterin-guanine dinucleotide biosynthesis protein